MNASQCFVLFSVLLLLGFSTGDAQWSNGQNADLLLGQKDYTSNKAGGGRDSMNFPTDVAIDPVTKKLFVADIANNRVLRWPAVATIMSGDPPEAVFGQPSFDSVRAAVGPDRMNFATAIALDPAGRLWVADASNNRVLRFDSAGTKPSGAPADGVLGQPDFVTKTASRTQSRMQYVRGIAVDHAGTLWVSDQSNYRVLRFDNAASKPNGADADGVLGQADFTSFVDTVTQSNFRVPRGLVVDAAGRLFVCDSWNNRVLRFDNASSKLNGAPADGVLGQADFVSSIPATTQNGMYNPWGIELDPSGRLYVAEDRNSRVLWFNTAVSKANGADADGVLGQPGFITSSVVATQSSLVWPWGLFVDIEHNTLWVADDGNSRVLRFSASSTLLVEETQGNERPAMLLPILNSPNPFNPSTVIHYEIAEPSDVVIVVYDVLGREIRTLFHGRHIAGNYTSYFDAGGEASGMYVARLTAVGTASGKVYRSHTRMMLLR